jgi:hypothetical protein
MNMAASPVASTPAAPGPEGPAPATAPAGPAPPAVSAPSVAPAPPPTAVVLCDNCGAPVAGRYCGACGQRLEPPVHSLWHFSKVATQDLTHADSRVWRTLAALLFKPGYLTAQFLAGRRARYLPPLRLYLVLSAVFFLWFSATHRQLTVLQIDSERGAGSATPAPPANDRSIPFGAAKPGESAQQRAKRKCNLVYQGPWADRIAPQLARICQRIVEDNGRSLREALLHNLPRAMFLFLPLLAASMMLMYWRPRHYYVEHLLLFVHNHAFVFLVVMLAWAVALLPPAAPWVRRALFLYIPWYMYRSMRVMYGQGRMLTFTKLALLSLVYLVFGVLMLTLTSFYSAFSL